MSINCQSLVSKFNDIKLLLNRFEQYEQPIQVLCLQETWIWDADFLDLSLFQVPMVAERTTFIRTGHTPLEPVRINHHTGQKCITLTDPVETKQTKFSIGNFYRPPHTQVSQ